MNLIKILKEIHLGLAQFLQSFKHRFVWKLSKGGAETIEPRKTTKIIQWFEKENQQSPVCVVN